MMLLFCLYLFRLHMASSLRMYLFPTSCSIDSRPLVQKTLFTPAGARTLSHPRELRGCVIHRLLAASQVLIFS